MMPTPTEVMQSWVVQLDQERHDRSWLGMEPDPDVWGAGAFLTQCLNQGATNR